MPPENPPLARLQLLVSTISNVSSRVMRMSQQMALESRHASGPEPRRWIDDRLCASLDCQMSLRLTLPEDIFVVEDVSRPHTEKEIFVVGGGGGGEEPYASRRICQFLYL